MYYIHITFFMDVYTPAEDTLLLLDNLKCGDSVLEVGTGSGYIAIECAKRGSRVVAVDIDDDAINYAKKRAEEEGVSVIFKKSNLFEKVEGTFDTIIFNPPYLPGNAIDIKDLQWAGGGDYGDEIIIKFLKEAHRHLKKNGEIYIILSSHNRKSLIISHPYKFRRLASLKLAFHEIYVYQLKKA